MPRINARLIKNVKHKTKSTRLTKGRTFDPLTYLIKIFHVLIELYEYVICHTNLDE